MPYSSGQVSSHNHSSSTQGGSTVAPVTLTIPDGQVVTDDIAALAVTEAKLAASAVARSKLKTTTASGSLVINAGANGTYTLTGGSYSWWYPAADSEIANKYLTFGNAAGSKGLGLISLTNPSGNNTSFYIDERYVQASPPYRLGPLFAYLAIRPDGTFAAIQVAPDPIHAYHGPTDITPEFIRNGRGYRTVRLVDGVPMARAMKDPAAVRRLMDGSAIITTVEREITLAYKDADMAVIPHPFGSLGAGVTVALLEPGTTMMQRFADFCDAGEANEARKIIESGKLIIDNTPLVVANMPPGVAALRARWKLTA